jgi:hypothetical protein
MKNISKLGVLSASALLVLSANSAFADTNQDEHARVQAVGSTLEVHINHNGTVLARGAKVASIGTSTITATQTWGSYMSTWVVDVSPATQFIRRAGGASSLAEVSVGDYISFSGVLDPSQPQGTVIAKVVKDFSIQKTSAKFTGSVVSKSASTTSFVLNTKERGDITVSLSSLTTVQKGTVAATFADIAVGDKISKASGVWDTALNTLSANQVTIYVDQHLLDKRTFEGTIGSSASVGSSTPTSFSYTVGSKVYTVQLTPSTVVMSNNWNLIGVSLLHSGDKVRVYGAVQASNMDLIEAYVVRDTSIQ